MKILRSGHTPTGAYADVDLPARFPALVTVTALIYLLDAVALACGAFLRTPGTNSAGILAVLASVAAGLAIYAVLRGRRFSRGEATVMLAVQLVSVAAMSHTTRLDVAALSNGFGLAMLGAYTSWLLAWPAAVTYYAGLALWVGAVAGREQVYLTVAATLLAGQAVLTTEIIRALRRRVRKLTDYDPLTQVLNRRGVTEAVRPLLARHARLGRPLCVALVDLDDLRRVNNTAGHLAGDALLVAVADEWRRAFGGSPVTVGRIGGDEFVLFFDGVDEAEARGMLAAVRAASGVRWTAGVAQVQPAERLNDALARADAEMYANKAPSA